VCWQWAVDLAAPLESWARKSSALVLGGGWALYRFGLLRKGATALDIDLSCETLKADGAQYLVTFDVTLANKGAVKIAAKKNSSQISKTQRRL
jgi:hypothetical protein